MLFFSKIESIVICDVKSLFKNPNFFVQKAVLVGYIWVACLCLRHCLACFCKGLHDCKTMMTMYDYNCNVSEISSSLITITLGARGFSCMVSGVGYASIVTRVKNLWSSARFL